jgi:hypothetical protein
MPAMPVRHCSRLRQRKMNPARMASAPRLDMTAMRAMMPRESPCRVLKSPAVPGVVGVASVGEGEIKPGGSEIPGLEVEPGVQLLFSRQ